MKLLSLILILLPMMASANPENWRQFHLKVFSVKNILEKKGVEAYHTSCTGTLLNINNGCHLITNAHCIENDTDKVLIGTGLGQVLPEYQYDLFELTRRTTSRYDFFFKPESLFVDMVGVKKRFISKDLVELEVSPNMRDLFCKNLKPVDLNVLKTVATRKKSYAALGFFMTFETVSFLGDKAWAQSKERATLQTYTSSLNLKYLYHVPKMTTFRGMSGGLLINEDQKPIGILTRHIPYQEESYVIGLQEVAQFLNETTEPVAPHPEIYFSGNRLNRKDGAIGENGHGNGGENGHGNGGENGHGNGGENGHGNGGENGHGNGGENGHGNGGDEVSAPRKTLALFREPKEGVIDPLNRNRIILNRCGQQIDGYEDYIRTINCILEPITRPVNGLPSKEVQKGLLTRLFGNLLNKVVKGQGTQILYLEMADHLDGWKKFLKGPAKVGAGIYGDERNVSFVLKAEIENSFRLFDSKKMGKDEKRYGITLFSPKLGDHGRVMGMVEYTKEESINNGRGTRYNLVTALIRCVNDNLLKLICSDDQDQFEISVTKKTISATSFEYRIAHRTGFSLLPSEGSPDAKSPVIKDHEIVMYYYGKLELDEKAKLSDLPRGGQVVPFMR